MLAPGLAGLHLLFRSPDEVDAALSTLAIATPQTAFIRKTTTGVAEFPLYCEGVDRSRFAYAIYLLNKVIWQNGKRSLLARCVAQTPAASVCFCMCQQFAAYGKQ